MIGKAEEILRHERYFEKSSETFQDENSRV